MSEGVCTCPPPAAVCRAHRRAVAGGGSISDSVLLIASQTFYIYIYMSCFLRHYQRSGKNVKCKLRQRCARGEAAFPVCPPLTLGNLNSDGQPLPNSGAHSIIFDTLCFILFHFRYQQSRRITHRARPWVASDQRMRLPVNSGVLNSQSHRNRLGSARQTADVSVERCVFDFVTRHGNAFFVSWLREAHLAGAPPGFFFADIGLEI